MGSVCTWKSQAFQCKQLPPLNCRSWQVSRQTQSVYFRKRLNRVEKDHCKHFRELKKKKKNETPVLNIPHMCISLQSFSSYEYINIFPSHAPDPASCPLFTLHSWKWRSVPAGHSKLRPPFSIFYRGQDFLRQLQNWVWLPATLAAQAH